MFESIISESIEREVKQFEAKQLDDVQFNELSEFQKNFARKALEGVCRERHLEHFNREQDEENFQLKLATLTYAYPEVGVYREMHTLLSAVRSDLESIEELQGYSSELKERVLQVQKLMGEKPAEDHFVRMFRETDCIAEFPEVPSCSELKQAIYLFAEIILEKPTIEPDAMLFDADDSGIHLAVDDSGIGLVDFD